MTKPELLQQINEIFIDVFNDPRIVVTEQTTAADVEEWDSLNHIQLVVAIEKRLKVKFRADEIRDWKNVGEMCSSILSKTNPAV